MSKELSYAYEAGYRDGMQEPLAEVAALRELVLVAWKCIHSGVTCSDCRLIAGGCTLQTAMRKLGIEAGA